MKRSLKILGLLLTGYMLCIYFQFQVHINYETASPVHTRKFTIDAQPWHEMKPINMFGNP